VKNNSSDALLSFLGLCRRAGKMTLGCDVVKESMVKGESVFVLTAQDLSHNTEKDIEKTAQQLGIKVYKLWYPKEELSIALGKYSAVVSINDKGFAKKIMTLTDRHNEEECNL